MSLKSFANTNLKSLAFLALVAGVMGLTSCMNDNDPYDYPDAGYISIYNGAPSSPAMIVYADQNRVNDFPLKYSDVLSYKNFFPGDRLFKFSEANSLTSLLEKQFEIKVDSVYSMFIVEAAGEMDAVLVDDDWSEPTDGEAQLRMVNLSPDAGSVSLMIDEVETPMFTDLAFKANSEFESLDNNTYNLTVVSSSGEVLASATNVDLKGSRVYTLVLRGYELSTDPSKKLDLQLLTNYIDY
ncbi:uncharacterized protein DUF4397 [Algoriphagus chordae]|uniref:Uncharacterized protein DUF4397 n=2 Tax=Algoriphagus chordae TaxID=237019 RepID=A0A2W7QTI5_9BACT|nr:uncharacterized protein DUF4397 [Algoriphagus chordae]